MWNVGSRASKDHFKFSHLSSVYIAKIPSLGAYGVFAACDIKKGTHLAHYSGIFGDGALNPEECFYSFMNLVPGYLYSGNQAFYALRQGNLTSLINQAPNAVKNSREKYATTNTVAQQGIFKKIPFSFYVAQRDIKKDEQFLVNYSDNYETEEQKLSRYYFFSQSSPREVFVTPALASYFKEDYQAGCALYKAKNYPAALSKFKQAYFACLACNKQPTVVKISAAQLKVNLASSAEGLADTYAKLEKTHRAIAFINIAIDKRSTFKNAGENAKRLIALEKKLNKLQPLDTSDTSDLKTATLPILSAE